MPPTGYIGYLARAVWQSVTGLPEDVYTNDFALTFVGEASASDLEDAANNIRDFYSVDGGKVHTIRDWLSTAVADTANNFHVDIYLVPELPATLLGSPVFTKTYTVAATSTDGGLPEECSAVLSFHADLTGIPEESGATRPRARRRGRVFIGPLRAGASDQTSPPMRVHQDLQDDLVLAAEALAVDMGADAWFWEVWSRADNVMRDVVGGFVDDAFDTQRRRGPAATSRTSFTV